jgi:hypothetical protein
MALSPKFVYKKLEATVVRTTIVQLSLLILYLIMDT